MHSIKAFQAAGRDRQAAVIRSGGLPWLRKNRKLVEHWARQYDVEITKPLQCDLAAAEQQLQPYTVGPTEHSGRDLLGMVTMVLPRMELKHIGQWIEHHASLGVRYFWIWDDGPACIDRTWADFGQSKTWAKKPRADYQLHLSDEHVAETFLAEINKAATECNVTVCVRKVAELTSAEGTSDLLATRQGAAAEVTTQLAKGVCTWLTFLDIDEWLNGDPWFLTQETRPYVSVQQRVMADRWSQPAIKDITTSWGFLKQSPKLFVRTDLKCGPWFNTHKLRRDSWQRNWVPGEKMHFLHFYGNAKLPPGTTVDTSNWEWHYNRLLRGREDQFCDDHTRPILKRWQCKRIREYASGRLRRNHCSQDMKFAYMDCPKNGSTTILEVLQKLEADRRGVKLDPNRFVHSTSGVFERMTDDDLQEFAADTDTFTFCFVRDPFARALSAYLQRIAEWSKERAEIEALTGKPADQISFGEFLNAIAAQPDHERDVHWRTQTANLGWGLIEFDFVGRLETIETDLSHVVQRIYGKSIDLPHRKRTDAAQKADEYYTDELRQLVREIYAADFVAFGYS